MLRQTYDHYPNTIIAAPSFSCGYSSVWDYAYFYKKIYHVQFSQDSRIQL